MIRTIIENLKSKKKCLKHSTVSNNIENELIQEKSDFKIIISSENQIYKIEISDDISMIEYINQTVSSKEYGILDLISNSVLWNGEKQKVNKGTYYVITINDCIYNILFTDEKIKINERMKIKRDEQTQKENITQERSISYNSNKNEYHYFSAKHDETGDTYYTKYYSKNKKYSLGKLDLSEEETYNEINSVIYNLERIEGVEKIINIALLKANIIDNLSERLSKKHHVYSYKSSKINHQTNDY